MKKFSLFLLVIFFAGVNFATAMSSANYEIRADLVGSGGDIGSSATYSLLDAIGEPFIGRSFGTNFNVGEGFINMLTYSISLTLNSNVEDLGVLTPGTPITGSTTATVITDSWGGYDLYILENRQLTHTDASTTISDFSCSVASPCIWSGTGFGFSVVSGTSVEAKWGSSPNYKYAAIPLSDGLFHTRWGYKSGGDDTVIEYKLDVPTTQKSGVYSNAVTYTAVVKL